MDEAIRPRIGVPMGDPAGIGPEIALLAALIYYGVRLSYTMRTVKTAAMSLSWGVVYMSLPVGSFLVILSTLELILEKTGHYKARGR